MPELPDSKIFLGGYAKFSAISLEPQLGHCVVLRSLFTKAQVPGAPLEDLYATARLKQQPPKMITRSAGCMGFYGEKWVRLSGH